MWETMDYILQKNSELKTKQLKLNKTKCTWIRRKQQTTWFRNEWNLIGETVDQIKGGREKKYLWKRVSLNFSILQCLKTKNGSKSFNELHRHTHTCSTHANTHTQRSRQTWTNLPPVNTEIRIKKKKLEKSVKKVKRYANTNNWIISNLLSKDRRQQENNFKILKAKSVCHQRAQCHKNKNKAIFRQFT